MVSQWKGRSVGLGRGRVVDFPPRQQTEWHRIDTSRLVGLDSGFIAAAQKGKIRNITRKWGVGVGASKIASWNSIQGKD